MGEPGPPVGVGEEGARSTPQNIVGSVRIPCCPLGGSLRLASEWSFVRLIWMNWRDLAHPKAGGAEVYNHEVAKRLVAGGHDVTIYAGCAPGLPPSDELDGVKVVRAGGAVTTRLHAARHVRKQHPAPDLLIEEINTIPYWARVWSRTPVLLVVHQLAREVWRSEAPRAVAPVGYALEPLAVRMARAPAIALSASTLDDLVSVGYTPSRVAVIPPGIDRPAARPSLCRERCRFVYVGRLTPSKRIDQIIIAVAEARRLTGLPVALTVIGRGGHHERQRLEGVAEAYGIRDAVRFLGYVPADARASALASARAVVMASDREGWGMAVSEAAALGTPALVFRRPGLVDSTVHRETGLVVPASPFALGEVMAELAQDDALWSRLSRGAMLRSSELTWDRTAADFETAMVAVRGGESSRLCELRRPCWGGPAHASMGNPMGGE